LGLLLLRVSLGIALIWFGIAGLSEEAAIAQNLIACAAGIFLLAGLWTPVTGILCALDQIWIALSPHSSRQQGDGWIHIFVAIVALSVAMVGPGAWSVDAHLFGRKHFDFDRSKNKRPSP
jgi:putative oxidoreductase